MMVEDADQPARCCQSFVVKIRGNSLDRLPQVQKLRFSFNRHRTFTAAGELIHCDTANLTFNDVGPSLVDHRKFEDHLGGVVTYYLAPHERHRGSLNSSMLVQKWVLLPKVKLNRHLSSDPQNGNSELFSSNGFTRTDQDLPSIVHRIEQHRHSGDWDLSLWSIGIVLGGRVEDDD